MSDDDAVFIHVREITRPKRDARETHRHVALACTALLAAQRHRPERADAEIHATEFGRIPNAAVDDHSGPTVGNSREAEFVAEQCPTLRAATVDDQHLAAPRVFDRFPDA